MAAINDGAAASVRNATAANLTCVAPQDEVPASGMDVPVSTVVFAVAAALSGAHRMTADELHQ
jgi:hypothetical protein